MDQKREKKMKKDQKMSHISIYIPPMLAGGMFVAIALARRSHCLPNDATQRLAPKARPELT